MPTKAKNSLKGYCLKLLHNIRQFRTNHPIIYATIVFVVATIASFILEKCLRGYYNIYLKALLEFNAKRLVLIWVVVETLFLTLSYGKKGLDFIYKYRYLLGLGLFVLCVAMQINYSSSGMFEGKIQPNHPTQTGDMITGISRGIRTDEYVVTTPMVISQYRNDYDLVNPDIMADDVITSLYPKLPNKSLPSVLTTPQYLGFTFLPFEYAFSFYQLLPWFVAFFAVLEMLMVITKKRKLMSSIGSLFIIFSPVILWFDSVQYIMYVALLFDIFYLFINHGKNWKSKLAYSIIFGWVAACFAMIIYPAWQVPYGYILLALLIYLIIDNRKSLKWRDLLYVLPVLGVVLVLVIPNIMISLDQYKLASQTVYPGKRSESGGGGLAWIFYSISSIFFPIDEVSNASETSGFVCLFPIPIIVGIYMIFQSHKKKQYDSLLISLVVLSIFFSFIYFIGNGFISKITLLFLTPAIRLRPVLELVCLLIMIRLLSTHQKKKTPERPALLAIATVLITAILVYAGAVQIDLFTDTTYMNLARVCIAFVVYYTAIYCLLDNRRQTGYIIGTIAIIFAGYQFLTVHPLRSGLDVYTDKPVAIKIRELSSENQDALWITSGSALSQYALANDARVINSVSYYPVLERWRLLDPDCKDDDTYNRYAHIGITITQDATKFEHAAFDAFNLDLNYQDICLLHPTYFLSDTAYNTIPGWSQKLIYDEDGIYIYKFNCQAD